MMISLPYIVAGINQLIDAKTSNTEIILRHASHLGGVWGLNEVRITTSDTMLRDEEFKLGGQVIISIETGEDLF